MLFPCIRQGLLIRLLLLERRSRSVSLILSPDIQKRLYSFMIRMPQARQRLFEDFRCFLHAANVTAQHQQKYRLHWFLTEKIRMNLYVSTAQKHSEKLWPKLCQ